LIPCIDRTENVYDGGHDCVSGARTTAPPVKNSLPQSLLREDRRPPRRRDRRCDRRSINWSLGGHL